jgi:hypothetical protein
MLFSVYDPTSKHFRVYVTKRFAAKVDFIEFPK